ncbi:MAG: hypothetical protein ACR2LU_02720 [Luteitalea sp.]
MRASKLQPALLGGLFIGVLSALPVISAGNCVCCLWVVLGGILAAYLLQQAQPAAIDPVDGALVGLMAGLVGAVIATLLSIPIAMVMGPMGGHVLERVLEQSSELPPEVRSALEQIGRGGLGGAMMLVGLVLSLILNAIFATLGGLIGALLFKPSQPPPPAPVPGFADSLRPRSPEPPALPPDVP